MRKTAIALVIVLVVIVTIVFMIRRGFSARDEPTALEAFIAGRMRSWAVPSDVKHAKNPVPLTPAVLAEARDHFADHCAICHGNDGKGKSYIGQRLYPRTPDLTLASTQSRSDGELFATIENGVRLTGMPGFGDGTAASKQSSWELVLFIRHLPKITTEELGAMEKQNPKSAVEWKEMEAEESFLKGGQSR